MKIDKNSPLPIYYQIQQKLKKMIEDGELKPGDKIPSENELCESYKVSRMTVRQAVNKLVEEQLLVRYRGLGTFVQQKKVTQSVDWLQGFTEYMVKMGLKPSSKTLSFNLIKADELLAQKLKIKADDLVYYIERLRLADGAPIALEHTYLPVDLVPNLTEEVLDQSLYDYLEKDLGFAIKFATQSIEATIGEKHINKTLEVPVQAPVLIMEQITYIDEETPLEYVRCIYRSDRYKFQTLIHRQSNQ